MSNLARQYLAASGARAVRVMQDGSIRVARSGAPPDGLVSTQWVDERHAASVARDARRGAGDRPDASTASASLARAACVQGVTLTPDDVAVTRARRASRRIEVYLEEMRTGGGLRQFNVEYRRRRSEARAQGRGFMSYSAALARLRSVMIAHLVGRNAVGPVRSLFEEIFCFT